MKKSKKLDKNLDTSDFDCEKFNLNYDELLNLLKEAYRNGYSAYEMVESGLETYDSDGYARWVILGLK